MVISSSNNTSLVKYNPWKNKIKAAINTLLTLGVYNLVNVANDLGVTVNTLVGGTVYFSYNTYRFINDVWKTIKDTDGITDNSSGSVQDDTGGSLPEGINHYTPTFWAWFGNISNVRMKAYYISTDKNVYVTKLINNNNADVYIDAPIGSLAIRDAYFVPFTMYVGYIEPNSSITLNVSGLNNSDYQCVGMVYERDSNGNSRSQFTQSFNALTAEESNSLYSSYYPNNYPISYIASRDCDFSSNTSCTLSSVTDKGADFIFLQRFLPYFDASTYVGYRNNLNSRYYYPYNYTGNLALDNGNNGNTVVSLTDATVFPLQLYLNDFADKRTMSINGNNLGSLDYGGYTVGNSQPEVYNNPYYENRINYDGYSGDDWEELRELIIQSYDNGTQINDYTRQLYDVNTQQLVSIQNIDSTNNSILDLLLNGTQYTDGIVYEQDNTNAYFDDYANDLYEYEGQFADNFNDSLTDLQLQNPTSWGNDFIASANWVKEQYDRMTVNTQVGKLLGFSLALGFVLMIVGRLLR